MSKDSRFKHEYRKTASKQHRQVGEILRTESPWTGYQSFQEYPVNRINTDFESGRERFDWYVKELRLVIEVHGRQHYECVAFGSEDPTETIRKFREQQGRDERKRLAALEAGVTYIVVRYDEQVTSDLLYAKYKLAEVPENDQRPIQRTEPEQNTESKDRAKASAAARRRERYVKLKAERVDSGYAEQQRERAKEFRREQRRRAAEWKKTQAKDKD